VSERLGLSEGAISVKHVKGYTKFRLKALLALARLPSPLAVSCGVDLYRVEYSTELMGQPVQASGLVAVPRGQEPRGTIMWMNGTNVTRAEAPSMGSRTGLLVSAAFAGAGFTLLAPDYIGLGTSRSFHPYMHGPSTLSACIDFLEAIRDHSQELGIPWRQKVGLVGFSQGAYSTCVLQRELENHPIYGVDVVGAAAIATPLNLAGIQFPHAIEGTAASHSLYLSYIAYSYCQLYSQPLQSLIRDEWSPVVAEMFDGQHTGDQVMETLPSTPRAIFRTEVIRDFLEGNPSWFREALTDNEGFGWAPAAPLRFYMGSADTDVTPEDARASLQAMRQRGGDVDLIELGNFDHEQTVLHAVPRIPGWFRDLME
jgi:pimeloyl-ACP methyl ester carboxylesterase